MLIQLAKIDAVSDDLATLINGLEPRFREAFLAVVEQIRDVRTLEEISALLEAGQFVQALDLVETQAAYIADVYGTGYIAAGRNTTFLVQSQLVGVLPFDVTNDRAVRVMRENNLRIIRQFSQVQRETTRNALIDGIARGLNPIDQARAFRDSIGLTDYQRRIVSNYRDSLESNLLEELSRARRRALHDGRYNELLDRAMSTGDPIPQEQIDRMVENYRERWVKHRAETIARTEALAAAHEGADEAWNQAVNSGSIAADNIEHEWNQVSANRRESHRSLHGTTKPFGEPFISGNGNMLRFPGDPRAPVSERANCRCIRITRLKELE